MAQAFISSRAVVFVVFLVVGLIIYFRYYRDSSEVISKVDAEEIVIKQLQKASLGLLGMSNWEEIKKAALASKVLRVTDGKVDIGGKGTAFRREVVDTTLDKPKGILIFLHGQRFKSQTWLDLGTLHVMASYGYRTVAVDLPGYGNTETIKGVDYVTFMNEFLKCLHIDKPNEPVRVIVVSPSMSGSYSLPFLMAQPDKFVGYVPVAPVGTVKYKAEQYNKIKVPTLIVYGSTDTGLGEQSLKDLRNIPNSEVFKVDNAGHACYLDQPLVFHKQLKEFADKISSPK